MNKRVIHCSKVIATLLFWKLLLLTKGARSFKCMVNTTLFLWLGWPQTVILNFSFYNFWLKTSAYQTCYIIFFHFSTVQTGKPGWTNCPPFHTIKFHYINFNCNWRLSSYIPKGWKKSIEYAYNETVIFQLKHGRCLQLMIVSINSGGHAYPATTITVHNAFFVLRQVLL